MEIKHESIREALRAWAVETNREYVGGLVAGAYFGLGGTELFMQMNAPTAFHVNQQKLFRWLDSYTPAARQKVRELLPAILEVLPWQRKAKLLKIATREYRLRERAVEFTNSEAKAYVDAFSETVLSAYQVNESLTNQPRVFH